MAFLPLNLQREEQLRALVARGADGKVASFASGPPELSALNLATRICPTKAVVLEAGSLAAWVPPANPTGITDTIKWFKRGVVIGVLLTDYVDSNVHDLRMQIRSTAQQDSPMGWDGDQNDLALPGACFQADHGFFLKTNYRIRDSNDTWQVTIENMDTENARRPVAVFFFVEDGGDGSE